MSDNSTSKTQDRTSVIGAVKTPLGFFTLAVLIVEAVLLVFAAKAEGADRTIGIVGMILLLFASGTAVYFLASRGALNARSVPSPVYESTSFDPGVFPELKTSEWIGLEGRAQALASLAQRVNELRNKVSA